MLHRPSHPSAKDLAEALNSKRQGDSWMAKCPAHEDGTASLSIGEKNGKVLFHCHAGCSQKAVLDTLRNRGLWPQRQSPSAPRKNGKSDVQKSIVATYDYQDADGNLVFQTVRLEPKSFYQRRPDGKGGWVNNIQGIKAVPYRLPHLIEAVAGRQSVFVVEGEKDVENLAALGITATSNAAGAGRWQVKFNRHFKDADVVIIPDNDESGHKHSEKVTASLDGVASRIRVLHLPDLAPKEDVSDWLANRGGTVEKLW